MISKKKQIASIEKKLKISRLDGDISASYIGKLLPEVRQYFEAKGIKCIDIEINASEDLQCYLFVRDNVFSELEKAIKMLYKYLEQEKHLRTKTYRGYKESMKKHDIDFDLDALFKETDYYINKAEKQILEIEKVKETISSLSLNEVDTQKLIFDHSADIDFASNSIKLAHDKLFQLLATRELRCTTHSIFSEYN